MYLNLIWLCALLAGAICATIVYSVATFRAPPGATAAARRRTAAIEVLWALIPVAILFSAAAPSIRIVAAQPEERSDAALANKSPAPGVESAQNAAID